ncbi:MAG: transposase [Nitrosomonadales bacterium]|nr:transposase [Nitrosomonadales bacterium]
MSNRDGNVTFRYQNSETRKMETRTLGGVAFLRLILLHILPKGFRRARNFGFLHPNSRLVKLVQLIKRVVVPPRPRPAVDCTCCGKPMRVVRTRVRCAGDASSRAAWRRSGRPPCKPARPANLPQSAGAGKLTLKSAGIG